MQILSPCGGDRSKYMKNNQLKLQEFNLRRPANDFTNLKIARIVAKYEARLLVYKGITNKDYIYKISSKKYIKTVGEFVKDLNAINKIFNKNTKGNKNNG